MSRRSDVGTFAPVLMCIGIILGLLWIPPHSLFAMNCAVVHHPAPSEADTAFLAGEFAKAAELYQTGLAKNQETDLAIGLVHALLRQQKVQEAAVAVHAFIGDKPASAALLTLRAEVELRQGEPWAAAETAGASVMLDPCNPRTMLLFAELAELNSRHATAFKILTSAHQLEISGIIGDATLRGLTIHIDYRDGLVKLDYDPKRAGAFSH
jgi:hypothetical protein